MIYKLDNIPLSSLGAYPSRGVGYFALDGMLDLPKRIGKTEHDWGTSIEPFVQAQDIEFDGRTLTLVAVMKPDKVESFKAACITCRTLSFDHDYFDVVCRDEIEVNEVGAYRIVIAKFWQNDFTLKPITLFPSGSGVYMIDGFDLNKDFGIYISQSNSLSNTAKRIDVGTTEFYTRTNHRGTREITLRCSMLGYSFSDVYHKMNQFHTVLMQPGLRQLSLRNFTANVYFKDGITVNVITPIVLRFNLKGICL